MNSVAPENIDFILNQLQNTYGSLGFEFKSFKVSWYNSLVRTAFKLNYDDDNVAFLIISSPSMFEKAFIPFLQMRSNQLNSLKDPIDECMAFYLSKLPELFSKYGVKVVYDFELHPNRRPKVIMQCAAHASGAAYLYHPDNLAMKQKEQNQKMMGVCIHPKYGGWFALRAVAFFENLRCPNLIQIPPCDIIPSELDQKKVLELFNYDWRDWRYRDIIPVTEKYSDLQIKYFTATPGNRWEIIQEILKKYDV